MAQLKNTSVESSGFIKLPTGSTAQRPASPTNGMMRYNSEFNIIEQYVNNKWKYNPHTIEGGLRLHLDTAEPASYPGSGTTWFDLSGNSNVGTLINGVGYNSANGGSLVFDGINDHCLLPTNFFPFPVLNTFTISLWFRSTQTTGGTIFAQQGNNNPDSGTGGYVPVIYLLTTGILRVEPFWTANAENFITSTNALNNGAWHNIVITFNVNTVRLYVNSVFNSQRTGLTLTSFTTTYSYIVGAGFIESTRAVGTNYFNGNISTFGFYNRVLSDLEISQNFNAVRGRYGI
jgi:hypothetical protein